MSEDEYIQAVKVANPSMLLPDRQIVFKWHALETLLRHAFRTGQTQGAGSREQGDEERGAGSGERGKELFESLFGRFPRP
jgi:hypothetical protein